MIFTLTLTEDEVNTILIAISKRTLEEVIGVYNNIHSQCNTQIEEKNNPPAVATQGHTPENTVD